MICNLCPRQCGADRSTVQGLKRSICHAGDDIEVALVSLHAWEEPILEAKKGAGTIFFSHCNLRCCFCQNYEISAQGKGIRITTERLAEIFLEEEKRGASCIELVTPGHYTRQIRDALIAAKEKGLSLPIVYNSNAYELPETLRMLTGLIDIFLPDLKYFDYASEAIRTMFDMVGPAELDREGQLRRGLIIRHLVLPWQWRDSCRCLDWIHETFGDQVYVSVMNQYMPLYKACRHPEINRPLTTLEYQKVIRHARDIGITKGFMQVGRTDSAKFIPHFDGDHVLAEN